MSFHLQQGVCHIVALPFTLKNILRQEKNYENSYISPMQKLYSSKNPLPKRNQNPSRYYNSITNLKFPTQTKILSLKNTSRGQNPLSYHTLYNESKHDILAFLVGNLGRQGQQS